MVQGIWGELKSYLWLSQRFDMSETLGAWFPFLTLAYRLTPCLIQVSKTMVVKGIQPAALEDIAPSVDVATELAPTGTITTVSL